MRTQTGDCTAARNDRRRVTASETFSQKYAVVAETTAGGRVVSGPKIPGCLVRIDLGVLTVSRGAQVVAQAPVAGLREPSARPPLPPERHLP